jgi:hypothetical protein
LFNNYFQIGNSKDEKSQEVKRGIQKEYAQKEGRKKRKHE